MELFFVKIVNKNCFLFRDSNFFDSNSLKIVAKTELSSSTHLHNISEKVYMTIFKVLKIECKMSLLLDKT